MTFLLPKKKLSRSMLREITVGSSVELESEVRAEMEPALVPMHAPRGWEGEVGSIHPVHSTRAVTGI